MSFVPLYLRVKERIRADYLSGRAEENGSRLPTERELQSRYRVSRPTVSKALTALAAEGLVAKAQGRGSFALTSGPDKPPSGAAVQRIGYVAPVSGEALVQRAFRGIDRVAHSRNYCVLMGSAGNAVERERASVHHLIESGARGLVIYPVPRRLEQIEKDYLCREALGVPIVLMDTCIPEQGHTQIIFDNRRAGQMMTSWLAGQGHRRIGLISFSETVRHSPLAARLQGYQDSLHMHGIALDPALIQRHAPFPRFDGLPAILDHYLGLPDPPTALIAPEDIEALEIIELLTARGIAVPGNIQVVGFDHREAGKRFQPAFATTNPDFERMGELAGELLLDGLLRGTMPPRTYLLEVNLLTRQQGLPAEIVTSSGLAFR